MAEVDAGYDVSVTSSEAPRERGQEANRLYGHILGVAITASDGISSPASGTDGNSTVHFVDNEAMGSDLIDSIDIFFENPAPTLSAPAGGPANLAGVTDLHMNMWQRLMAGGTPVLL